MALAEVRRIFDARIDKNPSTSAGLGTDAAVVHSSVCESAVIRIQLGDARSLNSKEHRLLKCFE